METMSYHFRVERAERREAISAAVGYGTIIKEKYTRTSEQIMKNISGRYMCVTDTGIIIIKNETKDVIITAYVATMRELLSIYNGMNNIPKFLRTKCDRNQIKYIKNGKTRF